MRDRDLPAALALIAPVGETEATARWRWLARVCLVCVVAGGGFWLWRAGVLQSMTDRERLIALLRQGGLRGALFCIGVQFMQVVIFAIPGEVVQLVAGYLFGVWQGFLYSIIGLTLGSAFAFSFARVVGRPTLERLISPRTLTKTDNSLKNATSKSAIFLLFLLPGIPKDVLCYGAGLSPLKLTEFLVIAGLARSPALFASVVIGAGASRRDYRSLILTALVALPAAGAFYWYERHRSRRSRHP